LGSRFENIGILLRSSLVPLTC